MDNKYVWLVYASCGMGHYFPALTLKKILEEKQIKCKLIDILDYSPFFKKFYGGSYKFIIKYLPFLWNFIYDASNKPEFLKGFRIFIERTFLKKFFTALEQENPGTVVFTHFLLSELLTPEEAEKRRWFCIITDLGVHRLWLNNLVSKYFVGCRETRNALVNSGIDPERIEVTGIPVREQFLPGEHQGLESTTLKVFVNLIIFKKRQARKLLEFLKDSPFDGFVLCAKNQLFHKMASSILPKKFEVLQYREDIYRFMKKSDIIISKPGGSTLAEVLIMKKLAVFYDLLGGQEKFNLQTIQKHNIGYQITDIPSLLEILQRLNQHKELLAANRKNIEEFYTYKLQTIVETITG